MKLSNQLRTFADSKLHRLVEEKQALRDAADLLDKCETALGLCKFSCAADAEFAMNLIARMEADHQ